MHHTQPQDRPREKLEHYGAHTLGDNEVLAVVLGHGSAAHDALGLANAVLVGAGGLRGLARQHYRQLLAHRGVGPAQAARIQASLELGRRALAGADTRPRFLSPRELASYLIPRFGSFPVERFGVLLLDTRQRLLAVRVVSVGSVDASLAHPREVFRDAVAHNAAALVVFHNHPSGDPSPSADDLALTARLRQAGQVLGIELLDHLVLAEARYFSMKEQRLL